MVWRRALAGVWLLARIGVPYWCAAHLKRIAPSLSSAWLTRLHPRCATRLHRHLVRWGGLQIKIGQYLAARPDIMPGVYIDRLASLRDQVPARPFSAVQPVLAQAYDGDLERWFEHIEPKAVAAASFGQVHRGRLRDGQAVAVKIQYPGLRRAVAADLRLVRRAARLLAGLLPGWPLDQAVAEIERTAHDELDYVVEARAADHLREPLARYGLRVPVVIPALTRETVLVTEFVAGQHLSRDVIETLSPAQRQQLANTLIDGFLAQLLELQWFHADPHAGNLFLVKTPDGEPELWLLDFGMTGRIDTRDAELYGRFLLCLQRDDTDGMVEILSQLGIVLPGSDRDRLKALARELYAEVADINGPGLRGSQRQAELGAQVNRFLREMQGVSLPQHTIMLSRALGLIEGICMDLVPGVGFVELVQPRAPQFLDWRARLRWIAATGSELWQQFRALPDRVATIAADTRAIRDQPTTAPALVPALILIAALLLPPGTTQTVAAVAAGLAVAAALIGGCRRA